LKTEPEPEKPKEAFHGAPAGFRAAQAKKLAPPAPAPRPNLPGGQLPRELAFPADPQEPPEVVNLGRVPGSNGVRRVS